MPGSLDTTFLRLVHDRLTREFPGHVEACLRAVGEDDLWWRPHEQANAIGNLVLHLAGSNLYHVAHVIGGEPDDRDREAEFGTRGGVSRAELLERWQHQTTVVDRVLAALAPSRLLEPSGEPGRDRTVAEVLLHVSHHNALHLGQMVWVAKLRRPGVFDDLLRGGR